MHHPSVGLLCSSGGLFSTPWIIYRRLVSSTVPLCSVDWITFSENFNFKRRYAVHLEKIYAEKCLIYQKRRIEETISLSDNIQILQKI